MYMYSRVLNNSAGAVDCTGGGQTAGISNCAVQNKCRRYVFKINNCTGLTLREEKSATRKECRIKQCEFSHKKLDKCGINQRKWVKILENVNFISVNPQSLLDHADFKMHIFRKNITNHCFQGLVM